MEGSSTSRDLGVNEDLILQPSVQAALHFQTTLEPPLQIGEEEGSIQASQSNCQCALGIMMTILVQVAQKFDDVTQRLSALESSVTQQLSALESSVEELKRMDRNPSSGQYPNQTEPSSLQLHFKGALPDTLFTSNDICDEGASLEVELWDEKGRVEHESAEIKIVVVHGHFDKDDWTEREFNENIVTPRNGKLLQGKCEIPMNKGVAKVGKIQITDISSKCSPQSGCFRIGAQVRGLPSGKRIREAVSKAFQVKDRRGQSLKKPETPELEDDIWRLRNITEDGKICKRLLSKGILKVKDFLQLYNTDGMELQKIYDIRGKKWFETVKHAQSSKLSNEHYEYSDDTEGVDLVLNCAFEYVSIKIKGQSYQQFENLDESQKAIVRRIRCNAYEKRNELQITRDPGNQICSPSALFANMKSPHVTPSDQGEPGMMMIQSYQPGQPMVQNQESCPENQNIHPSKLDIILSEQGEQGTSFDWASLLTFSEDDQQVLLLPNNPCSSSLPSADMRSHFGGSSVPSEGRSSTFRSSSTLENATKKLVAACYMSKAATMFMISIQGDSSAPRKKRKRN